MAIRPTWEGHLRLSLVTCPVTLYKAVEPKSGISFNLINPKTKSRVKQKLTDASTGEDVERKELVKGYAVAKDEYILIDPEDIDDLKIGSTKTLDIETFVDAASIDRLYWDEPYYLVPDGKTGQDAFAVIRDAMAEQGRVGLGRIVLNQRERTVALEPRGNRILMTTLRAHDEVRDAEEIAPAPAAKANRAMLDIADKIIEQQAGTFDPSSFRDRYEEAVQALIDRKIKGQKPVRAERPTSEDSNVIDLMDALRRSMGGKPNQSRATLNAVTAKPSQSRAAVSAVSEKPKKKAPTRKASRKAA